MNAPDPNETTPKTISRTTRSRIAFAAILLMCAMPASASAQETMRAIRIHEHGGPEVLQVERIARPLPGEGELVVEVHAAAVNVIDTTLRGGGGAETGFWQLPYVPGFDVSGVVAEVGKGVRDFERGDEVFAMIALTRGGGYAEYAVVRADELAAKLAGVPHAEAAAIPHVGLTSWQALFGVAELEAEQTILIHGASGGVGSLAVQLAKWRGARVVATASRRNHAFLREIGADVVVDYNTQRFEDFAQNVDVVLDTVGGETQVRSLDVLREGGILVSLHELAPQAQFPAGNVRAASMLVQANGEHLARLAHLAEEGHLRPVVSHLLPLERAPEAHMQMETRHTRGKIVLQC